MSVPVIYEHEDEPIPGLPKLLPEGETILWQGRPQGRLVARNVLKTNWLAGYFVVLAVWAFLAGLLGSTGLDGAVFSGGALLTLGAVVIGLAELFAWGVQRTSLYTITSKRLVMRVGVALSLTVNIPFARISGVDRRNLSDDVGDLAIDLSGDERASWVMLWPHVRAWHFKNPSPVLRSIADVDRVSEILVQALKDYAVVKQTTEAHVPKQSDKASVRGPQERQPDMLNPMGQAQ